jgi:small-conductance mechanosensitive channel
MQMDSFFWIQAISLFKAAVIMASGFFLARFAGNAARRIINKHASSQQTMLLQKIIYFLVLLLFIVAALQQLGFKLSVLLGSAGILTGAVAIASQTSVSNIVSGIFLILERSFQVGDRIKLGNTQGTVLSVDLLSVKILTAHNTLVRIPNEALIKAEIANLSRFDASRLDIPIIVSAKENMEKVKVTLLEIATQSPLILDSPPPSVAISKMCSQEVELQLSVWSEQKNLDTLSDHLYSHILDTFKSNSSERSLLPI